MEIYLARHTSVDVPRGTCYGFTDVPLRATFRREATATRLRLGGLTFDHVYTSPLSRAAKLAAFCGYPDAERDERLKEMNMGHWEMQRFDDIIDERLQFPEPTNHRRRIVPRPLRPCSSLSERTA